MGALSDFERRLEGAVEGFFARAFRSGLQPIELAKAIQRFAEDHQLVTEDGVVVPNRYTFVLHPRDIERLETFGDRLKRELAEVAVETAKERGWQLRGPAVVRIDASDQVAFGTYRISGRVEAVSPDATGAVSPISDGGWRPARPGRLAVRVLSGGPTGAELELRGPRMVAGRRADCDVPLDDQTVSRHHAAFVRRGGDWWLVDLHSTNGTRVNGTAASERVLRPGDRIELGEAVLELVEV